MMADRARHDGLIEVRTEKYTIYTTVFIKRILQKRLEQGAAHRGKRDLQAFSA
jgi:hypothetical protein